MKLINTDGMTFIGPGSEWFWTALSGIILAVTFVAIYRQLRLQRSQEAIAQLDAFERECASERVLRAKLGIVVALRDGLDPGSIPDGLAFVVAAFWEKVGYLVRSGYIDRQLLWNGNGAQSEVWWVLLAPWIAGSRSRSGAPLDNQHFEWIVGVMKQMDRRGGFPSLESAPPATVTNLINHMQDRIRIEEALRTVILASPDSLTVGQPVAAAG